MAIMINEFDDLDIIIKEEIEFDIAQKEKYLKLFDDKISNGIIRKGTNFYDEKWVIKIGGVEDTLKFPCEIEMKNLSNLFDRDYLQFKLAYKSFILLNIHTPNQIIDFNANIKRIGKYFSSAKVDSCLQGSIQSFLNYIKISKEKSKIFENIIDNLEKKEYGSRILPEFEDVFKMSDIINDIVENKNILNYKDYILTIMWWKICSILPLRPSEFLRTKFKCVYKEEEKFYLKVRRSKAKNKEYIKNVSSVEEYYLEDIVNIDKITFNLILNYQDILKNEFNYREDIELFPFIIIENASYRKNYAGGRYKNLNTITSIDLKTNINSFYENVVEKEYGLQAVSKYLKKEKGVDYIEKLTAYDARHIAIINLILMGTDVLEVMHLSGHTNVNTAYSYFNHVKEISKGYALGYAKSIRNRDKMKGSVKEVNQIERKISRGNGNEEFNRILNTINGKKFEPRKVKGGYCHYADIDTDKSFCFFYERNHFLCKYFVRDNKEMIEEEIKKVENQLDTDIKILMDLIKDVNHISKFNELYQTTSYRVSKGIHELSVLNKKLIMEE